MNTTSQAALYAAVPLALLCFLVLKPRRAVMAAYIGGWMFLPVFGIKVPGIPDLSKLSATSFGVLFGATLFDFRTVFKFRPNWYDLPMLGWCLFPYVTSVKNGLGHWDGFSNVFFQVSTWGIPYFIGRVYFKDWAAFRELAVAILVGGLVYIPFCLFEIKFSPQLHKTLYGRAAHAFGQEKRWGGYRPQVFMESGLAVGMWMTAASLVGVWMWVNGSLKKVWGLPLGGLLCVLLPTTVLCKSTGALLFLTSGLATLFWIKYVRNPLPLLLLLLIPPTYMYQRASLNWDGEWLKEQATKMFGEERGQSLATRINAENTLTQHALNDAPDKWFGFGKWDINDSSVAPWRIYQVWEKENKALAEEHTKWVKDARGKLRKSTWTVNGPTYTVRKDMTISDGLWVITLGQYGLASLTALTASLLLGAVVMLIRVPMRFWDHPMVAPAAALSVLLVLDMCDNLLNGMVNPVFMLALGGICGIGPSIRKLLKTQPRQMTAPAPAGFTPQPFGQPAFARAGTTRGQPPAPAGYANPALAGFPVIPGLQTAAAPRRRR